MSHSITELISGRISILPASRGRLIGKDSDGINSEVCSATDMCVISGLLACAWSVVVTNAVCQIVPALLVPNTLLDCTSKSTSFCVEPISLTSSSQ